MEGVINILFLKMLHRKMYLQINIYYHLVIRIK